MEFNVADVKAAGTVEKREDLNPEQVLGQPPDHVHYNHTLHASARAQMANGSIYVSGRVEAVLTYQCARCLEEFERPFSGDFSQVFDIEESAVRVDEDIKETVLVEIPIKPLCREDCAGICAECGANRNRKKCGCKTEPPTKMGALLKDFPFN